MNNLQQKEQQKWNFKKLDLARELIISCCEMYRNVGSFQIYGDVFTAELERIATKLNIDHSDIKVIIGALHRECKSLQFSVSDSNDFISVTLTKIIKK